MSNNSLASLLAWMKDNTRMLGWGLVVALERKKTNLILLQEYIKRFNESSYLPPIRGDVEIVAGRRMEVIHDYVMDVPVLSFENADLNDSKAMLTMAVAGGSQLTMEKESVGWKVYKLDDIDPLQGPKLHLDLLLNEVPGNVDVDGRVKLDLSKSDNFRLTFAESQHEQRMGGDFFKDLFNRLSDEERIYTLGKIERGTNELMRPESFELRTQASSAAAARDPKSYEYGDGGILALVKMAGRRGGAFPGENFKYLIPSDSGKDYSATVLFDHKPVAIGVMLGVVADFFRLSQADGFDYIFSEDGSIVSVKPRSGELVVPAIDEKVVVFVSDMMYEIALKVNEFAFSVVSPNEFVVEASENGVLIRWKSSVRSRCNLSNLSPGYYFPDVSAILDAVVELLVRYEFVDGEDGALLRQVDYSLDGIADLVEMEYDGELNRFITNYIIAYIKREYLEKVVGDRIFEAFGAVFNTDVLIEPFIDEVINLNFGQAIQRNEIHAPHDIGFFGRINPAQTSFVINPMQPLMKQGGSQQFATVPVVAGVDWKVENLVEGPGSPGTISDSGLYQAPPASAIKGRFTRVRVTATTPDTGYHSSALVKVLLNELTVNPLIQVCDVGATVELAAGSLGGDSLQWSIKNPVSGESGEVRPSVKEGGDHTYHHGPVVANKTYVLDEIEVKNTRTNETRSVHVLALQKAPMIAVKCSADIAQGKVQLEAVVNGLTPPAEWSLPLGGPGSISQTGLYQVPQAATERYVVIFAQVDGGLIGKLEGHLILPLPLVEFPQVLGLPD